jgi:hypothetical protein
MLSNKFDKLSRRYPQLADKLTELEQYLSDVKSRDPNSDIVPAQVAKKLATDEAHALALLMLADDAGLLKPRYQVWCSRKESFLNDYGSLREVPEKVFCPYDNEYHDDQDYDVDLVFHLTQTPKGDQQRSSIKV